MSFTTSDSKMERHWSSGVIAIVVIAVVAAFGVATGMPHFRAGRGAARREPSQPVGALSGAFAVDGNGSATYSVEIQVPPGTGGATPSLQITYDSHRSNGYLGMGWALSGVSAIARCGANYRVDGYKAGVAFDARDRFCLDGRRLIAVSGGNGNDGTTYHTETESWTVLTSHGTCGSGPCLFTGTNKDGRRLSFGGTTGTTGSRILAQGRTDGSVQTWSIDSLSDLNGNTTTVSYSSDTANGEYYPVRIDYTSNPEAGLAAQRSVQFSYELRPDPIRRFLGGSQVLISKLMSAISTHIAIQGDDQTVLNYRLAYSQSSSTLRSRLDSMTLCDSAGICMPPTRLAWYTENTQLRPSTTTLPGPTYVILNGKVYPCGVLMDMNGDGIADYSQATEFVDGHTDLSVYLGQPDGSFQKAAFDLPGPLWRVTSQAVVRVGTLQDINGDGILDYSHALLNDDAGTSDYTVYLGTGHGFTRQSSYQLPGPLFWQVNGQTYNTGILQDLDGDGIPDYSRATLLTATGQQLLDIYKGTGTGFATTGTALPGPVYAISSGRLNVVGILQDINGDGVTDYSPATVNADAPSRTDLRVYLGQSPGFTFQQSYSLPAQMLWIVNGQTLESGALVDINGDGIPDYSRATRLESTGQQILDVYLGTANGFTAPAFTLPGPLYSVVNNQSTIQGVLTNWNGDDTTRYSRATQFADGRQELAVSLGNGFNFRPGGYSLPEPMFKVVNGGTYPNATYQDLNGDGLTDFVDSVCTMNGNGAFSNCSLNVSLASGPFPDLLQSVSNGFGGVTSIDYAPLTGGIYQAPTASRYPIRNSDGPMIVVSEFTNIDGRGSSYSYKYTYAGAHTDVLGHGWLGFQTITTTDVAGGRSSTVNYGQTLPFFGTVASSQAHSASSALLAQTEFSYVDLAPPSMQSLGVHEPVRTSEQYSQFTNGSADFTLREEFQYDAYGNVTLTSDLGDAATAEDDVFTCVRYSNDPIKGQLGYILQNKADRTKQGCLNFLAEADAARIAWVPGVDLVWAKKSYDARMNELTTSQYDDSHHAFLTDTFTVDAYGNTLSATNAANHTTTFSYDPVYHAFLTTSVSPPLSRNNQPYQLTTQTNFDPAFGMLLSITDANGNVTSQHLDGFGRPVQMYGPDESGNQVLLVTATWMNGNGAHYLQTRQRPGWANNDPSTWYWDNSYVDGLDRHYHTERSALKGGQPAVIATDESFDAQGRVHSTTAPYYTGDPAPVTISQYDDYDRPILTVDPAGVPLKIDYAEGGLKVTRTNAFGSADAQSDIRYFTARGLVRQSVAPNGLTKTYRYNQLGEVQSIATTPLARSTAVVYDSMQRVRQLTRSDTGTSTWTYDTQGFLTQASDAEGNTTTYSNYDALGRVGTRAMHYASATTSTTYGYDDPSFANGLGNLTQVDTTQALVGIFTYTYGYTPYGQAKAGKMRIAGDEYVYGSAYDPLGRVAQATTPDGSAILFHYATDTNVSSVAVQEIGQQPQNYVTYSDYTALGQVLQQTYDRVGMSVQNTYYSLGHSFALPKTTHVSVSGSHPATLYSRAYSWNRLDALTAAEDLANPAASESYGYNNQPLNAHMGFLTSATGVYGSENYTYDQAGNPSGKTGVTINHVEGKDWVASTSAGATFSYYHNGNLKTRNENGAAWSYVYDSGGMMVKIDKTDSGNTQSEYAAYDPSGRQVFSQRVGESKKTYWITEGYEVDDLEDGTFQHTLYVPGLSSSPIAAITKSGKGNSATPATLAVLRDLQGRSTAKGAALAAWYGALAIAEIDFDRLRMILAPLLAALAIFCGLGGTFRKKTDGEAVRNPVFHGLTPLVAVCFLFYSMPAQADLTAGANGIGVPTPGYAFFVPNQVESTVAVVDQAGTVTANVAYHPDGGVDQAHSHGTDNFRPKFAGTEWDPSSSLYHMGARYYDPATSSFLSPDPAGQFTSPYTYAGNSPVSALDPNGELAFAVAVIIGAALVGAYFGGVSVNDDWNPRHWNWESGKTYAGLGVGAVLGAVGAAAGGVAVQAGVALGASGGLAAQAAGVAVGIAGQALVGAGENAAFTALGGGSSKEILQAAGQGAIWGGALATVGSAVGGAGSQFMRRMNAAADSADGSSAARSASRGVDDAAEGFCGASFPAGTPVLTGNGSHRAIEQIKPGDRVVSRDLAAHGDSLQTVTEVVKHNTKDLVTITFRDRGSVTTTPEHPFRGYQRGWIQAKDLGPGSIVEGTDGQPVEVTAVELHHTAHETTVYNFAVDNTHDYRVGGDGILVHNPRKPSTCSAKYDPNVSKVTEVWSKTELKKRYPDHAEYKSIKAEIRRKARKANDILAMGLQAFTRVRNPVRTRSREWVREAWTQVNGPNSTAPTGIRPALEALNPHFAKQDVDEYLTRIQGGLTINEGWAVNQGPLNAFVNQTSGAAMGALSRRVTPSPITQFDIEFTP
jgi:RHS repeat-associated protein